MAAGETADVLVLPMSEPGGEREEQARRTAAEPSAGNLGPFGEKRVL